MSYYPLKAGNRWTYKNDDGSNFTNAVKGENNGGYVMTNSLVQNETFVKKDGDIFLTDSYEAGNMQPFLKENVVAGDTWDIKYTANGISSVLSVKILSTGGSKEVEGKTYTDVMEMEGVMSFIVNGNVFNAGTKYNWFYAKGVGLILTTSTLGNYMPLLSYELN